MIRGHELEMYPATESSSVRMSDKCQPSSPTRTECGVGIGCVSVPVRCRVPQGKYDEAPLHRSGQQLKLLYYQRK